MKYNLRKSHTVCLGGACVSAVGTSVGFCPTFGRLPGSIPGDGAAMPPAFVFALLISKR